MYLLPRSKTVVNIKTPKNKLQALLVDVKGCRQIYSDEMLIHPTQDGMAKIFLTNVSHTAQKLIRGTSVGEVEVVENENLHPWLVTDTTPLVPQTKLDQIPIPPLDAKRKERIKKAANLDHLPGILKDKYLRMLYDNHECISLDEFDLGRCTKGAHSIPTKTNIPPTYQKQFPLPFPLHLPSPSDSVLEGF